MKAVKVQSLVYFFKVGMPSVSDLVQFEIVLHCHLFHQYYASCLSVGFRVYVSTVRSANFRNRTSRAWDVEADVVHCKMCSLVSFAACIRCVTSSVRAWRCNVLIERILLLQDELSIDFNEITRGCGISLSDPCKKKSHFDFPDFNTDEVRRLIEDADNSWLTSDTSRWM